MQSLRDQLLKAGLVTVEQAERSNQGDKRRGRGREGQRNEGGKDGGKVDAKAEGKVDGKPEAKGQPAPKPKRPHNGPIPRMVDLSDPIRLRIFQAIEVHRLRGETQGDQPFYFTLRDGRVRKLFVTSAISKELEGGKLAIVENGASDQHVIVAVDAVYAIREADPEAVRFSNR
jgi:uncharacterized protein YaiL (DUF2058 family)